MNSDLAEDYFDDEDEDQSAAAFNSEDGMNDFDGGEYADTSISPLFSLYFDHAGIIAHITMVLALDICRL